MGYRAQGGTVRKLIRTGSSRHVLGYLIGLRQIVFAVIQFPFLCGAIKHPIPTNSPNMSGRGAPRGRGGSSFGGGGGRGGFSSRGGKDVHFCVAH